MMFYIRHGNVTVYMDYSTSLASLKLCDIWEALSPFQKNQKKLKGYPKQNS